MGQDSRSCCSFGKVHVKLTSSPLVMHMSSNFKRVDWLLANNYIVLWHTACVCRCCAPHPFHTPWELGYGRPVSTFSRPLTGARVNQYSSSRLLTWARVNQYLPEHRGPQWTSTHQRTIHRMPVITQLLMNLNRVNIQFHLGNQCCKNRSYT
jgi:hypothetical protein